MVPFYFMMWGLFELEEHRGSGALRVPAFAWPVIGGMMAMVGYRRRHGALPFEKARADAERGTARDG